MDETKDELIKRLTAYGEQKGYAFKAGVSSMAMERVWLAGGNCPCRVRPVACPCPYHEAEVEKLGHCTCELFWKKGSE